MHKETIFTAYRPVEMYWRAVQGALGEMPAPPIALRPIDAYLMRQVAALYPAKPVIIDLAAAPTWGASAVLWASTFPLIERVIVPGDDDESGAAWRGWLANATSALNLPSEALMLSRASFAAPDGWAAIRAGIGPLTPVIFSLPVPDVPEFATVLDWALGLHPQPILLAFPIGKVGSSSALVAALSHLSAAYWFALAREYSPFFAESQLAAITRRENGHISAIWQRLAQLYAGNFGFITTLAENTKLREKLRKVEIERDFIRHELNVLSSKIKAGQVQIGAGADMGAAVTLDGRQFPPELTTVDRLRARVAHILASGGPTALSRAVLPKRPYPYRAVIEEAKVPAQVAAGAAFDVVVTAKNTGRGVWYMRGMTDYPINLSYHWYTDSGKLLLKEGERSPLPHVVGINASVIAAVHVRAPETPGDYRLQIDLVHEGVRWFSDLCPLPLYPVKVTRV
jgi:hypothetical protein